MSFMIIRKTFNLSRINLSNFKILNFDVERMEVLFDLHILIMSNRYLEVTTEL